MLLLWLLLLLLLKLQHLSCVRFALPWPSEPQPFGLTAHYDLPEAAAFSSQLLSSAASMSATPYSVSNLPKRSKGLCKRVTDFVKRHNFPLAMIGISTVINLVSLYFMMTDSPRHFQRVLCHVCKWQ
jgi:hypothetical protein